jgi:outer membrane protein assembly factor BamB
MVTLRSAPPPPRQRSPWLITAVLLLIVALLAGSIVLFGAEGLGLPLAPTPTLTATPGTAATPTADMRATMQAEDRATLLAYIATATRLTPSHIFAPHASNSPLDTPAPQEIGLPLVNNPQPTSTQMLGLPVVVGPGDSSSAQQPPSPLLPTPVVDSPLPTPPPDTVPIVVDTPTLTPTIFIPPTETPTWTPTPSPTVFFVQALRGVIRATNPANPVWVRQAPINTVTPVGTLVPGNIIELRGRDETGEWVYICCVNDEARWIRQAYAQPTENPIVPGAPLNATPNDVRWLPTVPWPGNFSQPPVATPIPPDDFPLFRHDRANTGRIPGNFAGNLAQFWAAPASVAGSFTTPVLVAGSSVIVASSEPSLYGFDRNFSNQTWKYTLPSRVSRPMALQDTILYFADDAGFITALPLGSNVTVWRTNLGIPSGPTVATANTGVTVAGNALYIGIASGSNYVVRHDRVGGAPLNSLDIGAVAPRPFAIGSQLLYVAGAKLWALDLNNLEIVWTRDDLTNFFTAPVYAANGLTALAELYVGGSDGRIHVLDANTGLTVRSPLDGGGKIATSLAFNDTLLFSSGPNFIHAYDRRTGGFLWRTATSGEAAGGLFVSVNHLVLVTTNGWLQLVNAAGTGVAVSLPLGQSISQAPAISGVYIFAPVDNLGLFAFRQP